mgnify:CR=1 FL=1
MLYGTGHAIGNILGGRYADRSLYGTLIASLIAGMVLLLVFSVTMSSAVMVAPLIFLWGIASFAVIPPLQSLVVQEASEAPNLASAMNIGAFNLGNAVGAALGGGVISVGLGLPSVALAGAATAVLGLLMVLVLKRKSLNKSNRQIMST